VLRLSALSNEVAQGASGDPDSTILGRLHLLHVRSGLRYLLAGEPGVRSTILVPDRRRTRLSGRIANERI
jgi:hypothetical protein